MNQKLRGCQFSLPHVCLSRNVSIRLYMMCVCIIHQAMNLVVSYHIPANRQTFLLPPIINIKAK